MSGSSGGGAAPHSGGLQSAEGMKTGTRTDHSTTHDSNNRTLKTTATQHLVGGQSALKIAGRAQRNEPALIPY